MKCDTRERFTLRLPTALYLALQNKADEIGVSLNALILQNLWDWINARRHEHLLETKEEQKQ